MLNLSPEYWNSMAGSLLSVSALLVGFSFLLIISIDNIQAEKRQKKILFRSAVLATSGFLVSIFSFLDIIIMTSKGYPFQVTYSNFLLPRILGVLGFMLGLLSILFIIIYSGRLKNYDSKWFTLIVGIVSLILILLMLG